jgi:aspartate/glutamate racemase
VVCIGIPCKIARYIIDVISRADRIPAVNILDETISAVQSSGCRDCRLLSTSGMIKSGFCQKALREKCIKTLQPDDDENGKSGRARSCSETGS